MLTTTSAWNAVRQSSYRQLNTGIQVSFTKTTASGVRFFTINESLIGGNDFLKGAGDTPTFFDTYQYTDYTGKVTDWSISRQLGQFPYGLIMAQADVQFDNTSKQFLPNYDATIGSGILPGRPLKIAVGFDAESLQQFVGFTGQPELTLANRKMAVHAFDAMDYLNNYSFTTSGTTFSGMLQNVSTSGVLGYYLTNIGFSAGQFVLDSSLQPNIGYVNVLDRKFGDVINDLMEAEQGLLFADENGVIRFWNKQHIYTNSGTGYRFNLDYNNIIDVQYANTPVINDVIVKAKPRSVQPLKRVYTQQSYQTLRPGTTTTLFINFSDDYGALPVTSVATPTGGVGASSYYVANSATDESGTDLTSSVTVVSSYNFGTTYQLVLNNASSTPTYLTQLALNGTPAEVTAVIEQRYSDPTSIANYGRNPANNGAPLEIDNDYIQDAGGAQSLAYQLVAAYKDPRVRYVVDTFSDPARQIGDYGSIYIQDIDQTKRVFILGKKDILAPGGDLQQQLILEERAVADYFTIGVSTIGGLSTIAP